MRIGVRQRTRLLGPAVPATLYPIRPMSAGKPGSIPVMLYQFTNKRPPGSRSPERAGFFIFCDKHRHCSSGTVLRGRRRVENSFFHR